MPALRRSLRLVLLLAAVAAFASTSFAQAKACTKKGCPIASGTYFSKATTGKLDLHVAPYTKDIVLDQSSYHAGLIKGQCKNSAGTQPHAEPFTGTDPFRFKHAAAPKIGKTKSYRNKYTLGQGTGLVDTYTLGLKVHMRTAKKGKLNLSFKLVEVADASNGGGTSTCTGKASFSIKR